MTKCRPQRLLCRAEFLAVQAQGRRHRGARLTFLVRHDTQAPPRVGLTISRRVGNAVVRNKIRRRLREIVWAIGGAWPRGWDVVIIAQPQAAAATFGELCTEVQSLLARASRPRRASPPAHAARVP